MNNNKTTNSSQKLTRIFSAVIATTTLALGNVPNAQAGSFSFTTESSFQNTFSNTNNTQSIVQNALMNAPNSTSTEGANFSFTTGSSFQNTFSNTNNTQSIVQNALMNPPSSTSNSTGGCMFANQSLNQSAGNQFLTQSITQSLSMCAPTRPGISISIPGSSKTEVDGSDWKAKILADLADLDSTEIVSQTNDPTETASFDQIPIPEPSTEPESVPEPSTLLGSILAFTAMVLRRRVTTRK